MKHFILIMFFGLFALFANATPVHDTSPPGISNVMHDGMVNVFVQPSFDIQQAEAIPTGGLAVTYSVYKPDIRTTVRLCTYPVNASESYNTAIKLPPAAGELVNTLQVPRITAFDIFGVHRACTIRTQYKVNRTRGYLI